MTGSLYTITGQFKNSIWFQGGEREGQVGEHMYTHG